MIAGQSEMAETSGDDFFALWHTLMDLAEDVSRKGFDEGRLLGRTAHEVRGVACHLLESGGLLVLAGDKLGSWYAGTFDPRTGEPGDLTWHELPPLYAGGPRFVVDILRIVEWMGEPAVVAGTRGDGARIVPLSLVAQPGWTGEGLVVLPGGEGKAIRRLLFDPVSRTLWAAGGTHLLAWALDGEQPRLTHREDLGFRVTALAIDQDEEDPARDQLYIATNRCDLHRFDRTDEGGFRVAADALDLARVFWRGRTSVIEWLEPLSAIRRLDRSTGRWVRRYGDRGVFGATLRHLVLVCDDPGGSSSAIAQTRIATLQSKVLDLETFCLPSWQCLAVATLEGKVRLFRPSGLRRPEGDECAPYPEDAAEIASPAALFSGFEDLDFPERVYGFALPAPHASVGDQHLPVVLGLGNHTVRLHQLTTRWELRRQSWAAARMLAGSLPVDGLLDRLQAVALSPDRLRREKIGLIQVIPELGARCGTEEQWRRFRLLIWDALAHLEEPAIPILMIQALRQLQDLPPERREDLEETITTIRKYVLDRSSFSKKEADFLKLMYATDPSLADDQMIYRAILCSRRHDPVFTRNFGPADQFGEVQAFAAVPQQGEDGSVLPFDAVAPERMRFLVGTYRRTVWLLDGTGWAQRLDGADEDWGYVQALYFRAGEAVLAFSQGGMHRVSLAALLAPREEIERERRLNFRPLPGHGAAECPLAFCPLPGAGPGDDRFLWGSGDGKIFLAHARGSNLWADLGEEAGERGGPPPAIQDLRSFVATAPDGTEVALVAACTSLGSLHLRRWTGASEPSREDLEAVRIGNTQATCLLIAGSSPSQVIVAGMDGLVIGYWLLLDTGEDRSVSARLAPYWAYRAEQAVRSLDHLSSASSPQPGSSNESLLVAGSYDEHLHILDLLGRHLEIVYLPGTKVERLVTGRLTGEDSDLAEARVYACAFESQFRGLRVISRRRILEGIDEELRALPADEREERLTRWRAYSLNEGHLRHRFARQSQRYPGPGARDTLQEIRRFLEIGDSADRPTGLVTALLRRLFQNRPPGSPAEDDGSSSGLREILESPELYLDVILLLRQLEEQWNTPGSLENRRVQLFWIRSFLRNVESLALLRRWIALGEELEPRDPLAAPGALLLHFLDLLPELLQLKTLQYVERVLFGWRGVAGNGILLGGEEIRRPDLDWLLSALLLWLRTYRSLIDRSRPNPVTLLIGRLLGFLIREDLLDPLDLSHRLQDAEVSGAMVEILIDQCSAMGRLPRGREAGPDGEVAARMQRAAWVLTRARDLGEQLEREEPIERIVATLAQILDHTAQVRGNGPAALFLTDVDRYFRAVIPPLQVKTLKDLHRLKGSWSPAAEPCPSFRSYRHLAELSLVLEQVGRYWDQKHSDLYLKPMQCLEYQDFHGVRTALRVVRASFEDAREGLSLQERRLLSRLIGQWQQILDEEQNKELLQDLLEVMEEHLEKVPEASTNAVEAMGRVSEEERLTFTVFSNLFTRLLLFSEPSRALFIFRGLESRTVGTRVFIQGDDPDDYRLIEGEFPDPKPFPVPADWTQWESFERLEKKKIEDWLEESEPALAWEVVPIPIVAEAVTHFGFYAFGWTGDRKEGLERFRFHRLTWVVLLQALAFRQAAMNQDAMKSRMFSIVAHNLRAPVFKMRSDLGVLIEGWFEEQPESRQEKYRELLRQARQMTGIIDGILSLSSRETGVTLREVSLAKIVYEVVRTIRKDAQGKRIKLDFPEPDRALEQASLFWTDEVKVYDILLNLIGNAIKYSPPKSRVHVELQVQRRGADLRIRDEGPGIPKDELPLIFEPFFRGSHPDVESAGGMGLGLYITQLYVKKLNGRINVSNNPEGRGVSFNIFLPHQTSRGPAPGEPS